MISALFSIVAGALLFAIGVSVVLALFRLFGVFQVLPETTAHVYTLFGKVIGQVSEPGLYSPFSYFGPRALLLPFFGKRYTVDTAIKQSYLRNQLVNSEEGAPMGVGIWFEFYVSDPEAYLFKNSDPLGSLTANVASAVVKQLSNLKLQVLLEKRDSLSQRVREEVSPTSNQWGFGLGSTYIRKVAFRDRGMITEIERKVVNRLRQVTAGMKQEGENQVAIIRSEAERTASQRLGQAQAVRPRIVGTVLADIQKDAAVAEALFRLLDVQATLRSNGKVLVAPDGEVSLLVSPT
jgi:regulator of protease activity HflC (stomatin/prohibitin superfamily)